MSASRVAMYCSRSSAWMREITSCTNDRIDTMSALVVEQRRVVPLAPDRARRPCGGCGEARRARLLAGHQLVDQLDHRVAIDSCVSWLPVSGMPSTSSAPQPKMLLGLRRPAHQPEIAVPLEHRERRVVDVRRQHPVRAAQRVLVALLVVDVGVHRVDADDVAFGVAIRRVVDRLPSAARRRAARSS